MWRDAALVAGKDLRIEARSRVGLWQVVPFAVLVLVLVAFAIGPDSASLRNAAPGIFWIAVLFSTVLTIQRSVAVESGEGTRDGLRLSGIDPAGIFLGKAAAVGDGAGASGWLPAGTDCSGRSPGEIPVGENPAPPSDGDVTGAAGAPTGKPATAEFGAGISAPA